MADVSSGMAGDLTISVSVQIRGRSRPFSFEVRECANLNCERGVDGKRDFFEVYALSTKKFCCKPCRWEWNNKIGKVRG